jgi:hypothetical protein
MHITRYYLGISKTGGGGSKRIKKNGKRKNENEKRIKKNGERINENESNKS